MSDNLPRPRFHLTPERHWMNDPNGLVHDGERWHAYFQHNPRGIDWGNMSWGHASSSDLLRWTEHPVALWHRPGEQIFSGSIVIDPGGGWVATYTSAFDEGRQAQSRAVSRDRGETWQADPDIPVLDRGSRDFRDPKVLPHPDGSGWLMVAVEAVERRVLIYASDDILSWREVGSVGPFGPEQVVWECPDLVRLPVDGEAEERWVLLLSTNGIGDDPGEGSAMHAVPGRFAGGTFVPDADRLDRLDHGRDCYAGVSVHAAPGGETVMLAWMSNWLYAHEVPSSPWRGAMTLPRTLSLRSIEGTLRVIQTPVPSVTAALDDAPWQEAEARALDPHGLAEFAWAPAETGALRLLLGGASGDEVTIVHDPDAAELIIERDGPRARTFHPGFASRVAVPVHGAGPQSLLLSLDGPLLEVFADDGAAVASFLVLFGPGPVHLEVTGAPVALRTADPLASH